MNSKLLRIGGFALVCIGVSSACFGAAVATPEIDPASGGNALAMLAGALLIIRGRRR